jgi:phage FluMu protein Com
MLKMRCKSCSKVIGVESSMCGKQVKCPHCGAVNRVPHLKGAPAEKLAGAAGTPAEQPTTTAADAPENPVESPPVNMPPKIQVTDGRPKASRSVRGAPGRKKKNANPGLILACGSVLSLAVAGVAAFLLFGGKSAEQVASRPQSREQAASASAGFAESPPSSRPESVPARPLPIADRDEPEEREPAALESNGTTRPSSQDSIDPQTEAPQMEAPQMEAPQDGLPSLESGELPVAAERDAVVSDLPQVEFSDARTAASGFGNLPAFDARGFTEDDENKLVELYTKRGLFSVKEYPTLRRIFADRFARSNAAEIQAAWGEDDPSMSDWLEKNRIVKEELFLAIDPQVDDVLRALQIFKSLKDGFPEQIVSYANLAIAIAVSWDKPRSIYDFGHHQQRAKAVMPDGQVDEIESFRYFLKAEPAMQGRAQWLPWEFLVHVINHRTPLEERAWALQNYLASRAMFGKCYHDVPYDTTMLDTGSERASMNGHPYTLANLRTHGGVCAHQADYASRVGQSLGVPAAYVGGESTYGGLHAWVMWVEIKTVTAKSIVFTLESHGRYRGDRYYVGTLRDPKSGQAITDRQLELHLHTVGIDPFAKRHADLVMAAYPTLKDKLDFSTSDQFAYLSRTVELCPGHERAWLSLAEMATNDEVKQKHRKQMTGILNQLFTTFANFPDFTWTIFDDLIQFEDRLKERIKLYERLTLLYQAAQRPDLACEARLRLTDLLVEDGQELVAVDGLAATIYAFVDEGRYVPKMLDRIELICQNLDGATPHLLRFYNSFLPRIPQMRGDRPSAYCMETFERAIALFRQHGELAVAQAYATQLAQIRAGQGRR